VLDGSRVKHRDPLALAGDGGHVLALLADKGALLLRDVGLSDVHAAEAFLSKLGVDFSQYTAGVSPRRQLSAHLWSSTEAPAPYIISAHTEMCYMQKRPSKLFFYCEHEPVVFGETPVFDFEAALTDLPAELRDRVRREGFTYRRYFRTSRARLNVDKSLEQVFGCSDVESVTRLCAEYGMTCTWHPDGALTTDFASPGTVIHPSTGAECLSMTLLNDSAAHHNLRQFAHRLNPVLRHGVALFAYYKSARKDAFFKTLWGNGEPISSRDTREFVRTYWRNACLFKWRKGDLLLLDNIRFGHGRMNVQKPRLIAVGMADPYVTVSTRPLRVNEA